MKPILFNTQMVQAILEDRKTTTRRIIKNVGNRDLLEHDGKYYKFGYSSKAVVGTIYEAIHWCKAKFNVGDILYVRETWCDRWLPDGFLEGEERYGYKADGEPSYGLWGNDSQCKLEVWIPSIHMPKEAARIFLKVTNVRVERLQDIDRVGVVNEGTTYDQRMYEFNKTLGKEEFYVRSCFIDLWNSTVKKTRLHSEGWNGNPYVWVIEFERIDKSEVEQ